MQLLFPERFCVNSIYFMQGCPFIAPAILPNDCIPQFHYTYTLTLIIYWNFLIYWKFHKNCFSSYLFGKGVLFLYTRIIVLFFCFLVRNFILEYQHFSKYQENRYSIYVSFYMSTLGERSLWRTHLFTQSPLAFKASFTAEPQLI